MNGGQRRGCLWLAWLAVVPGCFEQIPLGTSTARGDASAADVTDADAAPDSPGPRVDSRGDRRGDGGESCVQLLVELRARAAVPEVMFALDRSSSMATAFGNTSRLIAAQTAIKSAVGAHQGAVHFGLQEFPARRSVGCTGCCAGSVEVHPGPNRLSAFERATSCDATMGCQDGANESPTADALRRIRQYYEGFDSRARFRYVILVTDGEPSCPSNACERAAVEASLLGGANIRTFVVTVGAEAKGNACLDALAMAGGASRSLPPFASHATDATELRAVVRDLAATLADRACHIDLLSVPPNADNVTVLFQGMRVPRDPSRREGWSFEPNSQQRLVLHGSWCDRVKTSDAQEAVNVYGSCAICGSGASCR